MPLNITQISDQAMAVACAYLDLDNILTQLKANNLAPDWSAQAERTLEDLAHAFPDLQLPALKVTQ